MFPDKFPLLEINLSNMDEKTREKFLDFQEELNSSQKRKPVLRTRDFRRLSTMQKKMENERLLNVFAVYDSRIIARGRAEFVVLEEDTNPDTLFMDVQVLPQFRKLGIAKAILRKLVEFAKENNHTKVHSWVYKIDCDFSETWLKRLGFKFAITYLISKMSRNKINWDYIDTQETKLKQLKSQYTIKQYDSKSYAESILNDDGMAERFADFRTEVDNLKPRENEERNEKIFTTSDMVEYAKKTLRTLHLENRIRVFAFDGDNPVAISSVYYKIDLPVRDVDVDFTGVRKSYQGKGLAKLLKIILIKNLIEEFDSFEYLITGNAGSNDAMLHINTMIGFEYEYDVNLCQGSLVKIEEYLD